MQKIKIIFLGSIYSYGTVDDLKKIGNFFSSIL